MHIAQHDQTYFPLFKSAHILVHCPVNALTESRATYFYHTVAICLRFVMAARKLSRPVDHSFLTLSLRAAIL